MLVLLMTAATGAWATEVASGDCGTGVTWSLTDDGVLTISGTGAMADYASASATPWISYLSSITNVVVETGVTHIGYNSFRVFANMTSLSLPEGLLTIGNYAFMGCRGLTSESFTIPASVTSIGDYAFYGCTALSSIEIPASVTSIGNKAFFNCSNLTSVTLNSDPNIGMGAFPTTATVTMNLTAKGPVDEKYWMTFYNQRYNFVADENTQVFKAELSGTSIILHEVTDRIVTKAEAVILKSTGNPVMTKTDDSSSNEDANSLEGVTSSDGTTAPDPSTIYVLNNGSQGVGFYKLASGSKLGANKAYLRYEGSGASAREFIGFDEATGIEGVSVNENFENGEVYDLQGRRVAQPAKGLYIVNGKKVFINK